MDAFYASIEQKDNPELKGKPIAVGGSRERGVIAAASYEARKFGVKSAMPSITAYRLCPHLIFVAPRFARYKEVSQKIMKIFKSYTAFVEPLSLDEAYLDISENCLTREPEEVANAIRADILRETGLNASAGVSYNKFLAKIASDVNKPNGIKSLFEDEVSLFLDELPIKRFFGIGEKTADRLYKNGIYKGKDLKRLNESRFNVLFGKSGKFYYNIVRGIDLRAVNSNRVRKSLAVERTFEKDIDVQDPELMERTMDLISELNTRLVKNRQKGKLLNIKIKYSDFQIRTKAIPLTEMTNELEVIIGKVMGVLPSVLADRDCAIRLLGLSMTKLEGNEPINPQLEIPFEQFK
mgnify:CR=1 FL=1